MLPNRLHGNRWFGRIKSYQPGNGYGFIECSDFGHDVYLSQGELQKLDIKTIPVGTEVCFHIEMHGDRPRATNLALGHQDTLDRGLPTMQCEKQCEYMLNQFAWALDELRKSLKHGLNDVSYRALREAQNILQCEDCIRDERTTGAKVLLLLEEARESWMDAKHPCHQALCEGLEKRFSAPDPEAVEMSIDQIRFTQNTHSNRFLHGAHAGQRIDWLTEQLLSGRISFHDPSMILNVVYFHGAYRSLNNRHLTAVVRYARVMESQNKLPKKCCVRVWPLLRGLQMDDGSDQDVVRKFLRASDTSTDGTSIDRKRRTGESTVVNQDVHIHVSNLERSVEEPQLLEHLCRLGVKPMKVQIARRPNGKSNCYGWVTFGGPQLAEEFLQMPIPPLEGRELKVRLDNVSATQKRGGGGKGWVRCRTCHHAIEPLLDVLLVEGERLRRDDVPAEKFDPTPTFFCVGREATLSNCQVIEPHPDPAGRSFKLAQVRCETCEADLGNVQKGSLMQGPVADKLGERVVHLKCTSVLLELSDHEDLLLEVRKWQYLAQATGRESIYRLSQLTMHEAREKLGLNLNVKVSDRNTNRSARVVPKNLEESAGKNGNGYPKQ